MSEVLLPERVAMISKPGEKVHYSENGYVITEDGTVYALAYRCYHGILLATLFPEIAKEVGVSAPVVPHQENDIFYYQEFEIDNQDRLPVIRVSLGAFLNSFNVSTSDNPCSEAQINSLLAIGKTHGLIANSTVQVNLGEVKFNKLVEHLRQGAIHDEAWQFKFSVFNDARNDDV